MPAAVESQPPSPGYELDEHPTTKNPSSLQGQKLVFDNEAFPWRDVAVHREDGSFAYFADIFVYTRNTPDIQLRSGSKDGLLVAAAHFRWGTSIKCGIGSDDLSMEWVKMNCTGPVLKKRFQFEWQGRSYSLCRTRNGVYYNYQVVEEASGELLAAYAGEKALGRKRGTLRLAEGVNRQLEVLIVLAIASWREIIRRRD